MKNIADNSVSHAGMMYTHEFKHWYNYLRSRLQNEWSPEDVSFLLGKPDFYYADFEKMYKISEFLRKEAEYLDRFYLHIDPVKIQFCEEKGSLSEERLVRMVVEREPISNTFQLTIPWEFKTGKGRSTVPPLRFQEWRDDIDLLSESDTLLHVRLELDKLFREGYFLTGRSSELLYLEVKKTEREKMNVKPRHLKQALYLFIQHGKIILRKNDDRFTFYEYK